MTLVRSPFGSWLVCSECRTVYDALEEQDPLSGEGTPPVGDGCEACSCPPELEDEDDGTA